MTIAPVEGCNIRSEVNSQFLNLMCWKEEMGKRKDLNDFDEPNCDG